MTPEEQTEFVALQDKLKAAEAERDEKTAALAAKDKDIEELKKVNQELFLRATTPPAPPSDDKESGDEEKLFTTEDLLNDIKGVKK